MENKIIFMGGAPRSGTTLVQRLLDGHSEITAGPELNALTDVVALYKQMKINVESERIDFYFSLRQLKKIFSDFISSFFEIPQNRFGVKIVSEKTPSNVLVFDELASIFPDSLFVFIMRDPKDVLTSYMKVKEKAKSKNRRPPIELQNLFLSVDNIYKHMEYGHRFCKMNPNRSFILKYEDLVYNPYQTSMNLMKFLGVAFQEDALKLKGAGQYFFEKRVRKVDSIYYSMQDIQKSLVNTSVGKWKVSLSKSKAGFVEKVFSDIAKNYDTGLDKGNGLLYLYNCHKRLMNTPNFVGKSYLKLISKI